MFELHLIGNGLFTQLWTGQLYLPVSLKKPRLGEWTRALVYHSSRCVGGRCRRRWVNECFAAFTSLMLLAWSRRVRSLTRSRRVPRRTAPYCWCSRLWENVAGFCDFVLDGVLCYTELVLARVVAGAWWWPATTLVGTVLVPSSISCFSVLDDLKDNVKLSLLMFLNRKTMNRDFPPSPVPSLIGPLFCLFF